MVRDYKIPGLFSDPGKGFGKDHDPEYEFALALQHRDPEDPEFIEALIDRYGGELYRFAAALHVQSPEQDETQSDRICQLVSNTFNSVYSGKRRFWGEASVRDWLLKISLELYRKRQSLFGGSTSQGTAHQPGCKTPKQGKPKNSFEAQLWAELDDLEESDRLAVVLYYLFDMNISTIANLLNEREQKVAGHIYSAQDRLALKLSPEIWIWRDAHTWAQNRIQEVLNGRLGGNPDEQSRLYQHLDECEQCRDYFEGLKKLDEDLAQSIQHRWPRETLSSREINHIVESVQARKGGTPLLENLVPLVRKASWIAVFVALFIGMAWWLTQQGYLIEEVNSIPRLPKPTTQPPPEAVQIPAAAQTIDWQTAESRSPQMVYNSESSMSGDGDFIAFTHFEVIPGAPNGLPEILLFDREQNNLIHINDPARTGPDGSTWGYGPDVSGDGHWVVFTSSDPEGNSGDQSRCNTLINFESGCLGIYLFDRISGSTQRIDIGWEGAPPDGESKMPAISADGRRIAFWSSAGNLTSSLEYPCGETTQSDDPCMDVFVFDRDNDSLTRIPIGRKSINFQGGLNSLGVEGHYLALTIHNEDQIAPELEVTNRYEVYLYDLQSGQFQLASVSPQGEPANGDSYNASLSANGAYLAFVSTASNLIPEDPNQLADLFVRDIQQGITRRLDLGKTESGLVTGSDGEIVPDTVWASVLNISASGRFVAFVSRVNNLDGEPINQCAQTSQTMPACSTLYLHDRETQETKRIAGPYPDRYFYTPVVSDRGRYVAYSEMTPGCGEDALQPICGELWLYDRQADWIQPVTKGRFPSPVSVQSLTRTRRIPEVSSIIDISADNQTLATVFNAKDHKPMINLWTVNARLDHSVLFEREDSAITAIDFSSDGEYLAVGKMDGNVEIWRLADQRIAFHLNGQLGKILNLRFSQDSQRIAVGSSKEIWIWELQDRTFVRTHAWGDASKETLSIEFSPDDLNVALVMDDDTVWVESIPYGEVLLRLGNGGVEPSSLAFSADGRILGVGSNDGSLNLWSLTHGDQGGTQARHLRTLVHPDGIDQIAFFPDGRMLTSLTNSGILRTWDIQGSLIDSHPQDPWDQVNTFEFSDDGEILATSAWTGPTYIYQRLYKDPESRYFEKAGNDQIRLPSALPTELSSRNFRFPIQSLYDAEEHLNFDLKAPTYLPPGFVFEGARTLDTGEAIWLSYPYYEKPGGTPKGAIYIYQGPQINEIADNPIGKYADVETVTVGDRNAEIIQGEWTFADGESRGRENLNLWAPLTWDPQIPSYRLRFRSGDQITSIYYEQGEGISSPYAYVNKNDMVAIAKSLVSLSRIDRPEPVGIIYTASEGDTCTSIAERFGSTVGSLVSLNQLTNDCMIFTGQELRVPLTGQREILVERDLNCDDQPERVQLIPYLASPDRQTILGIEVQTMTSLGFYRPVWRSTVSDAGARYFTRPQIFGTSSCMGNLALNTILDPLGQSRFEIYSWDGQAMTLVNSPTITETVTEIDPNAPGE